MQDKSENHQQHWLSSWIPSKLNGCFWCCPVCWGMLFTEWPRRTNVINSIEISLWPNSTASSNQLSFLVKLTASNRHQKRNFSHFSQIIFSPSIFQRFLRVCHVYLLQKFIIAEFKNLHAFSSPVLDVWPHGFGVALDVEEFAMSPNEGRYPTVATLAMPYHGTMPCCNLKSSDFYWSLASNPFDVPKPQ